MQSTVNIGYFTLAHMLLYKLIVYTTLIVFILIAYTAKRQSTWC